MTETGVFVHVAWLIAGGQPGHSGSNSSGQLVARGEQVTASVRAGGEELEKVLAPAGKTGRILVFDTRDEAAGARRRAQVSDPVDVLIANAGAMGRSASPLWTWISTAFSIFSISTRWARYASRRLYCRSCGGASARAFVFMSSVLGSMALEGTFNVGYRASKAALNKIGQCLADDLKPEGIAVVSMHPAGVRTTWAGRMRRSASRKAWRGCSASSMA